MVEDEFGGNDRAVVAVVFGECGFHFAPAFGVVGQECGDGAGQFAGEFGEVAGVELL